MTNPAIRAFFDEPTNTVSYLVWDPATKRGAVIDPVLDFDLPSGEADVRSAEAILAAAREEGVTVEWVLETHAHADHLSAAPFIKQETGAKMGHTPADLAYKIGDAVFVGDTLFMPDYGTARADFPGGDARQLYRSIRKLLSLPRETRLFLCHDYKAPGRDAYAWETTVGEQRDRSVHIHDGVSEEEFAAMREARDAGLAVPRLLLPSIQVNIRAGRFPEAEDNGVSYLRIPIKPVRRPVGG